MSPLIRASSAHEDARVTSNIAERLQQTARMRPHQRAVVFPAGRDWQGRVTYSQLTFRQLDEESDRLARGLHRMGVRPGMRLVLMVRPGQEFIALTFAVFKAGAVCILIDPGMGRSNIFRCLEEVEPDGFLAISVVQLIRWWRRRRFPRSRIHVTVGPRALFGGVTYKQLLDSSQESWPIPAGNPDDPAAVIFTSGSTGPPKGVLYEHGMFNAQVDLLQQHYGIQPGEVDLPGFPLFALFNAAMGVTTVIPDMDPTRPADVDPRRILEAIHDQGVTQAFGSPALWNRVGRFCKETGRRIPSLRRVLSAGAPVPNHVLENMLDALSEPEADVYTPYGATESLPVCSISGTEILEKTAEKTRQGAGTCVGRRFSGVDVKIVEMSDEPFEDISSTVEMTTGNVGEILVRGPSVTREYFRRGEATRFAKVPDGSGFWHRIGDVGYLDEEGLLWFCGRKAHVVHAAHARMLTVPCEALMNNHSQIYRSALVGIGTRGKQIPVMICEPESGSYPANESDRHRLLQELRALANEHSLTKPVAHILLHRSLPVDIRHNVKIFREKLVPWARSELSRSGIGLPVS